jgi:hypothetical protein
MVDGWLISVEPCCTLTEEQLEHIQWKLSVLAVSTQGLFDDPVLSIDQSLQAHYITEYHARETCQHIQAYLQTIQQDEHVKITLTTKQWDRSHINQLP